MTRSNPVWDAPTRLIHWAFPVGVGLMWWSGETGRMQIHSYVAYVLITLVVTRLTWGFVGSYHSRFSTFVVGPRKIARYVTQGDDVVGHNPLGALSTVALLLVLLAQGVSGLFSVDDVTFDGPLAYAFDGVLIDAASEWHETNWGILQGLVVLHLAAIAWHQWRKNRPMIQTMWRGSFADRVGKEAPVHFTRAVFIAVITAIVLSALLWWAPEAPSYY